MNDNELLSSLLDGPLVLEDVTATFDVRLSTAYMLKLLWLRAIGWGSTSRFVINAARIEIMPKSTHPKSASE